VKTAISLVGSLVLTIILSLGALAYTNNDLSNFDKDMVVFAENEEKALKIYQIADYADDNQLLYELQNNGIPLWKENKLLIEKMKEYDLPEVLQKQNELLIEYCDLRIKSYELIEKMLKEQTHMYEKEIASVNAEIQSLLDKLGGEN
jgi:rhomboid protease GluP